jgi:hypothetical protein
MTPRPSALTTLPPSSTPAAVGANRVSVSDWLMAQPRGEIPGLNGVPTTNENVPDWLDVPGSMPPVNVKLLGSVPL